MIPRIRIKPGILVTVIVAALVVSGCRGATPAPPDTAPSFAETVADQTYAVGGTVDLILPEASGGNGPLTYSLRPAVPGLAFDPTTRTLSGTPTTVDTWSMTYLAADGDANTADSDAAFLTFTITVLEADVAPSFTEPIADQTFIEGDIVDLMLPAASGGNGPLSYSLRPEVPGLAFDPATRTLSGSPSVADTYPMTYLAADDDENTADSDAATLTFTIIVLPDTAPSFAATVADQIYTEGEVVDLMLPEAGGGNGLLSYSLQPEVPGLTFDPATRTLSGTATTADTWSMTYLAVDGDANTADSDAAFLTFTITVREADIAPSFTETMADQTFIEGDMVDLMLPEASGGNGLLSYSLRPTVPGLAFDPAMRTLSGSPTVADTYPMRYLAADDDENTADSDAATLTFTITVLPDTAPGFVEMVADQSYTVGESVDLMLPEASGGNGPLTYSLQPAVPGLTFDPATRALSGTATTADTWSMTYLAVDGDANTADSDAASLTFIITVDLPEGILSVYGGSGDEVFPLNTAGEPLDETLYTLLLGDAAAEVYVIASNATNLEASPRIQVLETKQVTDRRQRRVIEADSVSAPRRPKYMVAERPWVAEFNNDPPLPRASASHSQWEPQRSVVAGDTEVFLDLDENFDVVSIPATARGVVTDGTTALVVWVADTDWATAGAAYNRKWSTHSRSGFSDRAAATTSMIGSWRYLGFHGDRMSTRISYLPMLLSRYTSCCTT